MNNIWEKVKSKPFVSCAIFFCAVAILGLFFSRVLLSIGTIMLGTLSIYFICTQSSKIATSWPFKLALLYIGWLALSIFYTYDNGLDNYFAKIGFKFSLGGIFFSLALFRMNKPVKNSLLLLFGYSALIIALGTLINYLLHFEEINILISKSKPIPIISRHFHISYSLMLGFSIIAMAWLFFLAKIKSKSHHRLALICLISNFILIHIIAARTGLIAMYGALAVSGFLYFVVERKRFVYGFSIGLILLLVGSVAVWKIEPLNKRFQNTLTDLNVYVNGGDTNWWSGAMRLDALENGFYVLKENVWLGVGAGQLSNEVQKMYEKRNTHLHPKNRKNPHNQFLSTFIIGGVIGGLLFLSLYGFLVYQALRTGNWLLFATLVMFFIGFNLENFLERQIGSCFFGLSLGLLSAKEKCQI